MQKIIPISLLAVTIAVIPSSEGADDQVKTSAIIERAINIAGGEAKLAKFHAIEFRAKGTWDAQRFKIDFAVKGAAQGLDRYHLGLELNDQGNKRNLVVVLRNDELWFHDPKKDRTDGAPKELVSIVKGFLRAIRAAEMISLVMNKEFTSSLLGESKLGDRAIVGVRITQKNYPELRLFFDKDTGLPVRSETALKAPQGDMEFQFFFSGYKDIDGCKHFTKIAIKGESKFAPDKLNAEIDFSEIKPHGKLDDKVFAKP